jgi:hypothetical protein
MIGVGAGAASKNQLENSLIVCILSLQKNILIGHGHTSSQYSGNFPMKIPKFTMAIDTLLTVYKRLTSCPVLCVD